MWRLPPLLEEPQAPADFRGAAPFPHVVLDGVVDPARLDELLLLVDEEPLTARLAEHYAFDASDPEPRSEALRGLRASFEATFLGPLSRLAGRPLARCDMRAYAYGPGHHLLPHTDHQEGVGRVLAYAYYLPSPSPPSGGELELFGGEPEATRAIHPASNRMIVFEVSDRSLHRVNEVLEGVRLSLAGWFYP